MDTAIYVGLSRQMTLQRALEVTANNIANADTVGFKVEALAVQTASMSPPANSVDPSPINYVIDSGVTRNFGQGPMEQTGGVYDLALNGAGFFQVQGASGNLYTRDGRFSLDAQNRLVDQQGDPVLSASGAPITLDPTKTAPVIAKDGSISQTGPNGQVSQVGKVGVVRIADMTALSKQGNNLFADPSGQTAQPATNVTMQQGMVEKSNVQSISEITNLIEVTRTYASIQDLMSSTQDLSSKAIDALGRLSA